MLISSVAIGLFVSLLFTEFTGILTGGLISPGYLALFAYQPERIVMTVCVSLLTAGFVNLCSRYVVIYGRRRFALCVLAGYLLGMLSAALMSSAMSLSMDLRVVGYIIPGLIAHDILRQGTVPTLLALGTAIVLTRLILELAALVGLF